MLDPDEMAAYEVWKQHKLTSVTDLSAHAFNLEQEAPALAWEAGVKAALGRAGTAETIDDLLSSNPYRAPGMNGARPVKIKPADKEDDE